MPQLADLLDQISDPPGMTGIPAPNSQPMMLRELLARRIGTGTIPSGAYDQQRLLEYLRLMQQQPQGTPTPQTPSFTPFQLRGMSPYAPR